MTNQKSATHVSGVDNDELLAALNEISGQWKTPAGRAFQARVIAAYPGDIPSNLFMIWMDPKTLAQVASLGSDLLAQSISRARLRISADAKADVFHTSPEAMDNGHAGGALIDSSDFQLTAETEREVRYSTTVSPVAPGSDEHVAMLDAELHPVAKASSPALDAVAEVAAIMRAAGIPVDDVTAVINEVAGLTEELSSTAQVYDRVARDRALAADVRRPELARAMAARPGVDDVILEAVPAGSIARQYGLSARQLTAVVTLLTGPQSGTPGVPALVAAGVDPWTVRPMRMARAALLNPANRLIAA